jgi:hypothetical protein
MGNPTPEQLRRLRELPEDATQEQIDEALNAEVETPSETEVETPAGEETETAETPAEPEPGSTALTVTVDRAQWDHTQRQAAAGAEARREQLEAERAALVSGAIRDGRIAPASREAWLRALSNPATEQAERATLASLERGRIPLDPEGQDAQPDAAAPAVGDDGLLPVGLSTLSAAERERAAKRR